MAQQLKERRVYYLDYTGSMANLGLWDPVRENLRNAINKVEDETTELLVIPFTDENHPMTVMKEYATKEGKSRLCSSIDALTYENKCFTAHSVPLEDFQKNRIDPSRVTYMFLMTDGQTNHMIDEFHNGLALWGKNHANDYVYGFYVMLHNTARDSNVESIIRKQAHLWSVETADVDINLVRPDRKVYFNVRNDKYLDIPLHGNCQSLKFEVSLKENEYYRVISTRMIDNILRVNIKPLHELQLLPDEVKLPMILKMSGNDNFTFLVDDNVDVICKNQKEYSLKILMR
jgi:hypothetical protein